MYFLLVHDLDLPSEKKLFLKQLKNGKKPSTITKILFWQKNSTNAEKSSRLFENLTTNYANFVTNNTAKTHLKQNFVRKIVHLLPRIETSFIDL